MAKRGLKFKYVRKIGKLNIIILPWCNFSACISISMFLIAEIASLSLRAFVGRKISRRHSTVFFQFICFYKCCRMNLSALIVGSIEIWDRTSWSCDGIEDFVVETGTFCLDSVMRPWSASLLDLITKPWRFDQIWMSITVMFGSFLEICWLNRPVLCIARPFYTWRWFSTIFIIFELCRFKQPTMNWALFIFNLKFFVNLLFYFLHNIINLLSILTLDIVRLITHTVLR